jgi:mRNA interferase MazF
MKRGELWILSASGYASKPRPALIIQSDRYNLDESVVTCLITTEDVIEKDYRVELAPSKANGLKATSYLMLDKIVAIPRAKLNTCIGRLEKESLDEIYNRLMDFLAE